MYVRSQVAMQRREVSKPKNYPPRTTWRVTFCGLNLYGWDMSTIHASLAPAWEIIVKHGWRNLPKSFVWSNSPLGDQWKDSWRNPPFSEATTMCSKVNARLWYQCNRFFGEQPAEPFGGRKPFAANSPRRQTRRFAPRPSKTFTMIENPKPNAVGENAQKELRKWV